MARRFDCPEVIALTLKPEERAWLERAQWVSIAGSTIKYRLSGCAVLRRVLQAEIARRPRG